MDPTDQAVHSHESTCILAVRSWGLRHSVRLHGLPVRIPHPAVPRPWPTPLQLSPPSPLRYPDALICNRLTPNRVSLYQNFAFVPSCSILRAAPGETSITGNGATF